MSATSPAPSAMSDPLAVLATHQRWHAAQRAQFPILVAHPHLAYLDSSATAQKPVAVLDAVDSHLRTANANAGRGTYAWANATTEMVERARGQVGRFLGAPGGPRDESSVTFVDGASAGLRRVALDWLVDHLADGDHIVIPFADHEANAQPWLEAVRVLAERGTTVRVDAMPYEETGTGDYDVAELRRIVNARTVFVAATHVHHVYGNDMNIARLRDVVGPDATICLDCAQSVGHLPVDVEALDVDFAVFSGHKAMALPGIGVVWARNERGAAFQPSGWAGSPNTTGIVSLCAALEWLDNAGVDRIHDWTVALGALLTDSLSRMAAYEVLGCQSSLELGSTVQRRAGIVTFRHRTVSASDLGFVLDSRGIMVRSDGHCQARDGEATSSVRASMHVHTSVEEVQRLVSVLDEVSGGR